MSCQRPPHLRSSWREMTRRKSHDPIKKSSRRNTHNPVETTAVGGFHLRFQVPYFGGRTALRKDLPGLGGALSRRLGPGAFGLVRRAKLPAGQTNCLESAQANDPPLLGIRA